MTYPITLKGLSKGDLVAVAMSGGVDSSVAAALVVEAGYQVVGITLQLYDHGAMVQKKGSCCAGQDIYDARTVADHLGFPHYVLDYESRFKNSVIDDFADSYLKGETPIPCVRCNQTVKFKDLLSTAKDLGAAALVTGHYVQRVAEGARSQLHRGKDFNRDQSYFLFTTTQDQLDYLRFPLGHMTKVETRHHANRFGLSVSDKPDSQDICFVPNGDYASVVEKLRPGALDPGSIVHTDGRTLGTHKGIINFTIGQRRGIGISSPEPLYVVRLNPETKEVTVGPREALAKKILYIKQINWLSPSRSFKSGQSVQIKVRSAHSPQPATIYQESDTTAKVVLDQPEYGVSNGQAGVFYDNTRLLGGGWICADPSDSRTKSER